MDKILPLGHQVWRERGQDGIGRNTNTAKIIKYWNLAASHGATRYTASLLQSQVHCSGTPWGRIHLNKRGHTLYTSVSCSPRAAPIVGGGCSAHPWRRKFFLKAGTGAESMNLEEVCFQVRGDLGELNGCGVFTAAKGRGSTRCLWPCWLKGCTTKRRLLGKKMKIIACFSGDRCRSQEENLSNVYSWWLVWCMKGFPTPSKILGTLKKCLQLGWNARLNEPPIWPAVVSSLSRNVGLQD